MELPSPPPPPPSTPPRIATGAQPDCLADSRYDRYLRLKRWTAKDMRVAKGLAKAADTAAGAGSRGGGGDGGGAGGESADDEAGYRCYRHRDVTEDARLGRSTCKAPFTAQRCPIRQPTFPTKAGSCLCCPMAGHRCPPCWGCLLPLSRRRAFAGKRYERETGGTANVFFARETLDGERREVIFKLRDGEVSEDERENTRLVEGVGRDCGLVRPSVALEWVAELEIISPMRANASQLDVERSLATVAAGRAGERRPAVAAEVASGVSVDMLLRSHAQGPNKQDAQGARARGMLQRLRQLDSRSLILAAIFDLLFASGDRHLEHVLMRTGGGVDLIDNAHTILTPRPNVRHTLNSLFLPGANFHARNRLGFLLALLHHAVHLPAPCRPPARHSHAVLAGAAARLPMPLPRGRISHALPPATRRCLSRLVQAGARNASGWLRVRHDSHRLLRLLRRARMLLELGFEGALRASDLSPGYYQEASLHNGLGVPAPCCSLTSTGAPATGRMTSGAATRPPPRASKSHSGSTTPASPTSPLALQTFSVIPPRCYLFASPLVSSRVAPQRMLPSEALMDAITITFARLKRTAKARQISAPSPLLDASSVRLPESCIRSP